MSLVPLSCSSLFRRLWRSWREKSRDTELRLSSCRMDKASSGNSSNFLSASNTTYSPGSAGNLPVYIHTSTTIFAHTVCSLTVEPFKKNRCCCTATFKELLLHPSFPTGSGCSKNLVSNSKISKSKTSKTV